MDTMKQIALKIKMLTAAAWMPEYATPGSAAFDLRAVLADGPIVVSPSIPAIVSVGLAFEIPAGHAMMIYSRSGHGFNHGVRLGNCVGVIDSDYRGAVMVKMTSDEDEIIIRHGDKIAQAMIIEVPHVTFDLVEDLTDTQRGAGGFGSTDPRPIDTAINAKKPR